jgi:predicted RNase H-like nuclease (RuvC/YqgF family)
MEGICVATTDSRAYYSVLSRLRNTDLKFMSVNPSDVLKERCNLIVTSRDELVMFKGRTVAIEDLDDDPLIMKGQILSLLSSNKKHGILIGIDPGSRIGLAIYYGDGRLGGLTFNSMDDLTKFIVRTVGVIPNSGVVVKIGDDSPGLSRTIARRVAEEVSAAKIEIVDEKGTSVNGLEYGGLKRDQSAAAKIAMRKGMLYERR